MLIILTGGGSGGHIFPLIAVAKKVRTLAKERGIEDIRFLYVGPKFDRISQEVFTREGIGQSYILSSKWRRYISPLNVIDLFKLPFAIVQAIWILFWQMPDAVFSKGGYGSFPVMVASWIFFIPSRVIHESDSVPGVANRLAAPFAKRIGTAFESAALRFPVKKTAVVGMPIRDDLCGQDPKKARTFFDIISARKVVLVMGGSQGAKKINDAVAQILLKLVAKYEVIHICGPHRYEDMKTEVAAIAGANLGGYYHLYPFLTEEIKFALTLADIVISRAGASSIFEIAACGKPSILIPLPTAAQDHQRANAYEYAKSGGTIVIEENNLTPNLLYSTIVSVVDDPIAIGKMSSSAAAFAAKNASETIARK
ncbi:MAG: UDP-N-acetylglucosamine--N-acetylmuramyl-(pentapeptide) pyrophosphoryl-undecaprenol N-acetylglucosamine transferase [Patescibacteria group bacterium]